MPKDDTYNRRDLDKRNRYIIFLLNEVIPSFFESVIQSKDEVYVFS